MMSSQRRSIAEWAGFQVVWFACALGAAQGQTLPGVLAAAAFVGAVLATKPWDPAEYLTVLASGVIGLAAESALIASGLIRFAAPGPYAGLAPVWIVALWFAFGATLPTIASLLGKRLVVKGAIAGCVSGPLAYWAGAKVGAIEFVGSPNLATLLIAAIWTAALPALLFLRMRLQERPR